MEGVRAPVEILRDRYGVPHIYARQAEDLFFAQGYVHAQDRFYQMDLQRRMGAGRLSEMYGRVALEGDILMRTMGFQRIAEREYELLDEESRRYLDADVAGINSYIKDRKPIELSLEYFFLSLSGTDFEIPEWTPTDSMTYAKLMAWYLSGNFGIERFTIELIRSVGLGNLPGYFAPYRDDMPYILSDEELDIGASATTAMTFRTSISKGSILMIQISTR